MVTERVDRRLAAILVADVVGYSRLMGADEEGTLLRLKAIRRRNTARRCWCIMTAVLRCKVRPCRPK